MKKKLVLTDAQIEKLLEAGAKRWTKYEKDRLYLRDIEEAIGLQYSRYNTGNISHSTLNGEEISHAQCQRILDALDKAYIDLKEECISVDGREEVIEIIIAAVEEIIANVEEDEVVEEKTEGKVSAAQIRAKKKWEDENRDRRRYLSYRGTAKTFINKHAELGDLEELEKLIEERKNSLKNS